MIYTSISKENRVLFFRLPFNTMIVEIENTNIIDIIYNCLTMIRDSKKYIKLEHTMSIIALLLESIQHNETLMQFFNKE